MTDVRIIGVGSPFGDDRIGFEAVEAIAASGLLERFPDLAITALCCDRPGNRLVAALEGADVAIVVDAMRSDAVRGTIRCWDGGAIATTAPLLSSHGFGVAGALALGRALDALPPRVVVCGIEIGNDPLSIAASGPPAWMRGAMSMLIAQVGGVLATLR